MWGDVGLLILRLVVGLILAGHGAQKLFGWFGGPGLTGAAGWLGSLGLRPARFWAVMAGLSEFGGGLLMALGWLSPLGELGIIGAMLMAIALVHWGKGLWNSNGGSEGPLTNLTVALALALTGPGSFSLDDMLGSALPRPATLWIGLALVILAVITALMSLSRQPATAS